MEFMFIAHGVPGILGKRDKSENFFAQSAEEARRHTDKKVPKAKYIHLYQKLSKGEKPEHFGQEYTRAWRRDDGEEWGRVTPGQLKPIAEVSDATSDGEYEAYLRSAGMLS